jgi:UDP-N-acetylmuramoylalanine--D-glutamate ligase
MFANFLAASLVTYAYGVDIESIRKGLIGFQGVPHRFELVATHNGVTYINDTAATIPEASLASVQAVKNNVILLAGGSDKGLPLEPLIEAIKRSKYTFLFAGSGTESIDSLLQAEGYKEYQIVASMDEALKQARMRAEQDTTVLLAPGAASFGMFRNEFDRGDQFRAAVLAVT